MSTVPSDLAWVRVRELDAELVLEVEVPSEVELPPLSISLCEGVLTIRLPRVLQQGTHIPGFHPDASGV